MTSKSITIALPLAISAVALALLLVLLGASGGGLPVAQAAANTSAAGGDVLINEIRIDQSGSDDDEYFELAGTAGITLDGLTYLVIGDGTDGSGVIEAAIELTGTTIPADGCFLVAEDDDTFGATADLTTTLNFENSDNVTHLLVDGFTGSSGDDLDTDDDGTLDVTPWTQIIDLIALIEEENPPAGTEYHYGPPTVGPDGIYVPGHVYRCSEDWVIGAFDPVGGDDTPGTANICPARYDAGIAKTGPIVLVPGSDVTYTIVYSNAGIRGLTGVVITDVLPAGTTYVTDTSGLTCTACSVGAAGPLTWTLGTTLTFGANVSFDLVVHITDTASGDLENTASIAADQDDELANNAATYTGRATAYDLEVTKSVDTAELLIEDGVSRLVTYTIEIRNYSLVTDTTTLTVTDVLPDGFVYVSDDSGTAPPTGTGTAGLPLIWTFTDTITHGTSIAFHVVVSVTDSITASGLYQNQVSIIGDPADKETGNNSAQDDGVFVWRLISIAEARQLPAGEIAVIEGTVTVEPGVFTYYGTPRYMYIQDDTGGVLVYYPDGLNAVDRSNRVRVVGEMTEYRAETEIQPADAADVTDLGADTPVSPALTDTGAVDESLEGQLVQVSGVIVGKPASYRLQVDDGSGIVEVYRYYNLGDPVDPNYIDFGQFVVGDAIQATGVTRGYDYSGVIRREVIPRGPADIAEYPRVLSTSPEDGATGVPVDTDIEATFNLTMTNVDNTTFLLEGPGGAVAGTVAFDEPSLTAAFDPDVDLDYGTVYTATLAAELAATNGLTRGKDTVWSFTTGAPELVITKTVEPEAEVPLGGVVTYIITIANDGDGPATGVVMTDTLRPEVAFGGWVDQGSALLPGGDTITWGPHAVPADTDYTIRFTATVTTSTAYYGASVTNTVEFDSLNAGSGSTDAIFTIAGLKRIYLPLVMRNYP